MKRQGMSEAEYCRWRAAHAAEQTCDCGRRAVRKLGSGFACARCYALELAQRNTRIVDRRVALGRVASSGGDKVQWSMSDSLVEMCAALTGGRGWGSLDWLEGKLNGARQLVFPRRPSPGLRTPSPTPVGEGTARQGQDCGGGR